MFRRNWILRGCRGKMSGVDECGEMTRGQIWMVAGIGCRELNIVARRLLN